MRVNDAALTRLLVFAVPTAVAVLYMVGLGLAGLAVLIAGIAALVARRRSLPTAFVGSRPGRWWAWSLAGAAMVAASVTAGMLSGEFDATRWLLFSVLFVVGALTVSVSVVRALAWKLGRPPASA
ncbi:MAG: hypothetical protein FJ318_00450 [SAR202 cluster bacterium]|nr:hypothetical protein [SAR202 cluster bacterium]